MKIKYYNNHHKHQKKIAKLLVFIIIIYFSKKRKIYEPRPSRKRNLKNIFSLFNYNS